MEACLHCLSKTGTGFVLPGSNLQDNSGNSNFQKKKNLVDRGDKEAKKGVTETEGKQKGIHSIERAPVF